MQTFDFMPKLLYEILSGIIFGCLLTFLIISFVKATHKSIIIIHSIYTVVFLGLIMYKFLFIFVGLSEVALLIGIDLSLIAYALIFTKKSKKSEDKIS